MLVKSNFVVTNKGKTLVSVELLPALPPNWSDGSIKGVRARGGLTIDMSWAKSKVTMLVIHAQKPCTVTLTFNGNTVTKKLKTGRNLIV